MNWSKANSPFCESACLRSLRSGREEFKSGSFYRARRSRSGFGWPRYFPSSFSPGGRSACGGAVRQTPTRNLVSKPSLTSATTFRVELLGPGHQAESTSDWRTRKNNRAIPNPDANAGASVKLRINSSRPDRKTEASRIRPDGDCFGPVHFHPPLI